MADSNVDLQIRILTDANTEGIKTTQKAIEDLSEKAEVSTADLRGLSRSSRDTAQAADALAEVMRGNLSGAMRRLPTLSASSTDGLIKLGGAAAALKAGYTLGTMIDQTLGLSDAIGKAGAQSQRSFDALSAFARTDLSALRAELDGIAQVSLEGMAKDMDAASQASQQMLTNLNEVARAQERLQLAEIRAKVLSGEISGDEGALQEARVRSSFATSAIERERTELQAQRDQAEKNRQEAAERAATLAAELESARARMAQTSTQAGVAPSPAAVTAARAANERGLLAGKADARGRDADLSELATSIIRVRRLEKESSEAQRLADEVTDAMAARLENLNRRLQVLDLEQKTSGLDEHGAEKGFERRRDEQAARDNERQQQETARAQAQADRERLKALEAELKDKEKALAALEKTGPGEVARERGEAAAAARELEDYSGLKPSQGGGSISKLRELRDRSEREAAEVAEVAGQLVATQSHMISQIETLRRSIQIITSQLRNAEQ